MFPRKWMILSCFMLFGHTYTTHPAHIILEGITDTISRIQRVHDLVEVSLPVIYQYQCIRYNELKSLGIPEPISIDMETFYDTLEFDPSKIPNDDFNDAYHYPTILHE